MKSIHGCKRLVLGLVVLLAAGAVARQQEYDHEAIQYEKGPVADAISRLQGRLDGGQAKLGYDEQFGWLPCILWILGGVIFIGAVHDFSALVASVRHRASPRARRHSPARTTTPD